MRIKKSILHQIIREEINDIKNKPLQTESFFGNIFAKLMSKRVDKAAKKAGLSVDQLRQLNREFDEIAKDFAEMAKNAGMTPKQIKHFTTWP